MKKQCDQCKGRKEIPIVDEYGYIQDEVCPNCNGWGYTIVELTLVNGRWHPEPEYYI